MTQRSRQNSFPNDYTEGSANAIAKARANIDNNESSISTFVQMIVLEVIFDPTTLDDAAKNYFRSMGIHNIEIVDSLPRNTILAKQVSDGSPGSERPPMFVYPFFAHLSLPIKPGEHVWVLLYPNLEKKAATVAYWMSRVVEPNVVDDVNHTHSPRIWDTTYLKGSKDEWNNNTDIQYGLQNGRVIVDDDGSSMLDAPTAPLINSPYSDKVADAYIDLQNKTNAAKISPIEPVPRFRKRPGDFVFEGSNNTLIAMGQDRSGPVAEYDRDSESDVLFAKVPQTDKLGNSGAIDIVVGRGQTAKTLGKIAENIDLINVKEIAKTLKNDDPLMQFEGDPDFKHDKARILLSQRTSVDTNFSLSEFNVSFDNIEDSSNGDSAAVIKADKVRIIARSDIEFLVSGFETDDQGNVIELTDVNKMAAIVIRKNGDIIFRPSKMGVIKLGDDTADKAILCTDEAATIDQTTGEVTANPIISTAGGLIGHGNLHGLFAKKVLVST